MLRLHERGPVEIDALPGVDPCLTIERQMMVRAQHGASVSAARAGRSSTLITTSAVPADPPPGTVRNSLREAGFVIG